MTYKIDKNVPIEGLKHFRYPMKLMEIGDSFFVPDHDLAKGYDPRRSAYRWGKRYGKKFSGLKVEGGIRVWRTG